MHKFQKEISTLGLMERLLSINRARFWDYYDKNATTHNKEKQKRLYIGKVVDGSFVPNKKFQAHPNLSRADVGKLH